jgi:hypothetical protein
MEFVLTVLYNQYFICTSQEIRFVPPGVGTVRNLFSYFMRCQMYILNDSCALALNDVFFHLHPLLMLLILTR